MTVFLFNDSNILRSFLPEKKKDVYQLLLIDSYKSYHKHQIMFYAENIRLSQFVFL